MAAPSVAIGNDGFMTISDEEFNTRYERAMRFMGAFSATQFAIDSVLTLYLQRETPQLGPALIKAMGRIRDHQRVPLFKAFSQEVSYQADWTRFEKIYERARQTRNLVGHAQAILGPVYSAGGLPKMLVTHVPSGKDGLIPDPLEPSSFTRLTADCDWLSQHARRAGYVAEPTWFIDAAGNPSEPPVAPPLPQGGEPLS
jgi:hypothetical protein